MKKNKMIPRQRLENESEKDYKLYLREFYFNLNPPKPSTRYDFAYENSLVDSEEVMDGKDGEYVRYLESFYNDYYNVLEQQVNLAFHMPNSLVSEKQEVNGSKLLNKVSFMNKSNKTKKNKKSEKTPKVKKEKVEKVKKEKREKTKKEKNNRENKVKKFINNIKKNRIQKKQERKNKDKVNLFEKALRILPKVIMLVAAVSGISSCALILRGIYKAGLLGLVGSVMVLATGALLDDILSKEKDVNNDLDNNDKIEVTKQEELEPKKEKKQKGKVLSFISRIGKKNKKVKNEEESFVFDTTSVKEDELEFEFDTTSVKEEELGFEFDTTSVKEEELGFEFDTTGVKEEDLEFEFDLSSTYDASENTYRLSKNQIVDSRLEFDKPISRNEININQFTMPKLIEQKDVKRLIKK